MILLSILGWVLPLILLILIWIFIIKRMFKSRYALLILPLFAGINYSSSKEVSVVVFLIYILIETILLFRKKKPKKQ